MMKAMVKIRNKDYLPLLFDWDLEIAGLLGILPHSTQLLYNP
jgi:hypothetical protein